nr:MAG TPA: hypothetical protein [Caudoviricetes sp.]
MTVLRCSSSFSCWYTRYKMALAFPMSQLARSRPSSPPAQTCGLSLNTFSVTSSLL